MELDIIDFCGANELMIEQGLRLYRKAHPTLGSEVLTTFCKILQALGMKSHSLK